MNNITLSLNEMFFYILQQKLYISLISGVSQFSIVTIVLFFIIGILSSLTPCFISVVPLSFAFFNSDYKNFMRKNSFISGLCTSVFIFIFILNILNYKYINYVYRIPILSSFLLCLIALSLLEIIDISTITSYMGKVLNRIKKQSNVILSSYITGFLVGISTLPCSSSIIYIITFWLSHSINSFYSIVYLLVYMLGYLLAILLIFNITLNYSKIYFIFSVWNLIAPLSGFFILTFSLFNILEKVIY